MDLDCLVQFAAVAAKKAGDASSLLPDTSSKFLKGMWQAFKWPLLVMAVIMIIRGGGASLWRAIWNSLK
jgi:hypothetical protein